MFKIGDRVRKTSPFYYSPHGDISRMMIKNIGTVIDIRYKNTPNAHPLYIVQFDGKSLSNELHYHYTESSLELFKHS
jgi:hypothetical protein